MHFHEKTGRFDVSELTRSISEDANAVIAGDELCYESEIDNVCEFCIENCIEVLLLCGPSAAGKTTTSKILEREFKEQGHPVNRLSLDNFYKPRNEMPLWEDGEPDLESIAGLNIALFSELVSKLFSTGSCVFPVFDFVSAKPVKTFTLTHCDASVLIIEGIHALNPAIYEVVRGRRCCRLYISAHSDFVNGDKIVIPARELRLIRRTLRDFKHRGSSLNSTLGMWKYIKRGEELYIYPFRPLADFHINTAHSYEPFLYSRPLEELILSSEYDNTHAGLVKELLVAARSFSHLPYSAVPEGSLIQEFIR